MFQQEYELVAPLPISDELNRGRGLVGVVDAQFGESSAAVFFKEEAARQALTSRRRGRGRGRGG